MTDPVKKTYRRLLQTDDELCALYRQLGSMQAVANHLGVNYQTVTDRFKSLRDDGLDLPKQGRRAPRTPERIAQLQAIISGQSA